ncbi:uncharacterized protein LOC134243103 [Saccostrea cucullata]|uniref:uncharacterized protein LOC134243103 n=1 Tax=Saccostrea cuccullata TaxID=36930 RepID=UPI002ED281D0
MKSTLTISVILSLFVTNQVIVMSAVVTNRQLLLGSVIGATLLVPYVLEYKFLTPEWIALLTSGALLATIPRRTTSTSREPTCTASGYKFDPSAGCFLVVKRLISPAAAKQECINDGGSLLLVNSAAEGDVLTEEMKALNLGAALVQGSRINAADPWRDDNGNPLPYTGSDIIYNNINAYTIIGYVQENRFAASSASSNVIGFICETPVTYI